MKKLSSPFDLIKKAVNIFAKKENLIFFIKIYIPVAVLLVIYVAQSLLPASIRNSNSIWLILGIVLLQGLYVLTSSFVMTSGIVGIGKVVAGGELSVKESYKTAWKKFWMLFLLNTIIVLISVFGFLLLIVPGVLFSVWFAFSRFILIEKKLGIKESLLKSRKLVKGNFWKIFGRQIVFGVFLLVVQMILSVVPYGVGSVISGLCGGLFMLPLYLLYKELDVVQEI